MNPTHAGVLPPTVPTHGWVPCANIPSEDGSTQIVTSSDGKHGVLGLISIGNLYQPQHPTINPGNFGFFRLSFRQGETILPMVAITAKFVDIGDNPGPNYSYSSLTNADIFAIVPGQPVIQTVGLQAPRVYKLGSNVSDASGNRMAVIRYEVRFATNVDIGKTVHAPAKIKVSIEHWEDLTTHTWGNVAAIQPPRIPAGTPLPPQIGQTPGERSVTPSATSFKMGEKIYHGADPKPSLLGQHRDNKPETDGE